jgi:hypothetical protein
VRRLHSSSFGNRPLARRLIRKRPSVRPPGHRFTTFARRTKPRQALVAARRVRDASPSRGPARERCGHPPQPAGPGDREPRSDHDHDREGRPGSHPAQASRGVVARRREGAVAGRVRLLPLPVVDRVSRRRDPTDTSCTSTRRSGRGTSTIGRAGRFCGTRRTGAITSRCFAGRRFAIARRNCAGCPRAACRPARRG